MGNHLIKLISNDAILGQNIGSVCNNIAAWSKAASFAATDGFASLSVSVSCLNTQLIGLAAAANALISFNVEDLNISILSLAASVNAAFASLTAQINFALAACNCPYQINGPGPVGPSSDPRDVVPGPLTVTPCPLGGGSLTPFDCNTCPSITIQGTCTEEETYLVTVPCSSTTSKTKITTKFGNCENHDQ
jgi:hypothetical protein